MPCRGARSRRREPTAGKTQKRQPARQPNRSPITSIAPTYPRLACDGQGNIWLAFRGKPGGNWRVACRFGVVRVSDAARRRRLVRCRLDAAHATTFSTIARRSRPSAHRDMLAVFSGDGRGEVESAGRGGCSLARQQRRRRRRRQREAEAAAPHRPQSESDRSEQQHHVQPDRRRAISRSPPVRVQLDVDRRGNTRRAGRRRAGRTSRHPADARLPRAAWR